MYAFFFRLALLLAALSLVCACGAHTVSSREGGAETKTSGNIAWDGDEAAMLHDIGRIAGQYAQADPLDPPQKGFYSVYYGHFKIRIELLPLGSMPGTPDEDGASAALPAGPYALEVAFDKGLSRYEEVVDKIYADLAAEFDAKYPRVAAPTQ